MFCVILDLDVCETCLNVMKSLNFSETNWLMTAMASSAFDASIDMQRWVKAFTYGQLALKGYRYFHILLLRIRYVPRNIFLYLAE